MQIANCQGAVSSRRNHGLHRGPLSICNFHFAVFNLQFCYAFRAGVAPDTPGSKTLDDTSVAGATSFNQ
jgi:hypothetical protein